MGIELDKLTGLSAGTFWALLEATFEDHISCHGIFHLMDRVAAET